MDSSPSQLFRSNIDHNNRVIVALSAGGFGLLGSVSAFIVSVSALFVVIFFLLGKLPAYLPTGVRGVSIIFLTYFCIGALLSLFHFDPQASSKLFVMRLAFLGFVPLVSAFALTSPAQLRNSLEVGAAVGAILTALFVSYELAFMHERAWAGADNPGPFAVVMSVMYCVCVIGCVRPKLERNSVLCIAGASTALFCILASGMRALLPIVIIAPYIAIWTNFGLSEAVRWKKVLGLSCVVILLLAVFSSHFVATRISQLTTDIEQIRQGISFDNSLGQRILAWDYALQKIPDSPWIGFGEKYSTEGLAEFSRNTYGITATKTHFHNIIVTSLMRGGILELVGVIALVFGPLYFTFRRRISAVSRYGVGLVSCVTATYLCSGIFNIAFGHDIMDHLFIFMMAVSVTIAFNNYSNDPVVV